MKPFTENFFFCKEFFKVLSEYNETIHWELLKNAMWILLLRVLKMLLYLSRKQVTI